MILTKRKAETEFHVPAKSSRVEEVLTRGSNALMQLNEIGIKGLQWNIEPLNNVYPQRFRATCLFTEPFTGIYEVIHTGVLFIAEGANKSSCRHDVANQIMNRLSKKITYLDSPLKTETILNAETFINVTSNDSKEDIRIDDAVRLLNEKIPSIVYNFKLSDEGYHCTVDYEESLFQGVASSKKLAKRHVAIQILAKHLNYTLAEDSTTLSISSDCSTTFDTDKFPQNRRSSFAIQVQNMVKNGFEKLAKSLEVPDTNRKVLAGIVIGRKLRTVFPDYSRESIDPLLFYTETGWVLNVDNNEEILKLVVVTSGSKCLSTHEINSSGEYINDCHAEVVAKRALQYFLHRTIGRLSQEAAFHSKKNPLYGCDILESFSIVDPWTYKLKDDVKFHMYVSTSPCGDCRIHLPDNADSDSQRVPHCGLLRSKIGCGEGTIPTKRHHLETWDRVYENERLATMSCSDKICLWNVLGLQGALLSNVLAEPIYLNSITIGSLFKSGHCERSVSKRANGVTEDIGWNGNSSNAINNVDLDIEQGELKVSAAADRGFRVNCPSLLTVSDQDDRCPGKGSGFSCNWILGEEHFELISTSKGLTVTDNIASRLSKKSLFELFLTVFTWLPFIFHDHGIFFYSDMKRLVSYPDNALGAVNYQRKKRVLMKFFERQNLGTWTKKPREIDCFKVQL